MAFPEAILGSGSQVRIGDVFLDASVSESHELEAEVTDHAVEDGSDISDNYRSKPAPLIIEGIITNTPISTGFPGATAVNGIKSIISGSDPVKDAWETFKGYFASAAIITITTSLETYPSRVLTNLKVTRNSKDGQNLRFTCTARYLKIVKTKETAAITKIAKTKTAAKQKKGAKPEGAKPASEVTNPEKISVLASKLGL